MTPFLTKLTAAMEARDIQAIWNTVAPFAGAAVAVLLVWWLA